MPELPEVETFRRFLFTSLPGKTIKKVNLYWERLLKKPFSASHFEDQLINEKFIDVQRKGKYLLFFLQNHVLIVHLRMEGKFFVTHGNQDALMKSCLCKFTLSENTFLYYLDSRHFGTFHLENKNGYLNHPGLQKLGLEPFSAQLTSQYLQNSWKKRTVCIKVALLEQTVIVGIGNIYASEILFASQISPFQTTNKLTIFQLNLIIKNLRKIMTEAIAMKGTTIHTFSVNNQKGLYWTKLQVYGRQNQMCIKCQKPILKQQINGRGTYYCPHCQKK